MTLLEERPSSLSSSLATFSPDGVLMETSPGQEIKELNQEQLDEEKHTKRQDQHLEQGNDYPMGQQALQQGKPIPDTIPSSEFQKLRSTLIVLQVSLQKLQELISQKADRDELLQLHESVYRQKSECPIPPLLPVLPPQSPLSGGGNFDNEYYQQMYKTLMQEMDNMNNKMKKLEERSDLNVLITKRLENFNQPAATVPETSHGLNEVKAAINEHADRMMEYADTLLQMEALLASKADASGLQALRQSILELKKRSKEHSLELRASSTESLPQSKQGEQPSRHVAADEKVEKHEMMLNKLLKDMELLGTGILALSGHNHGDTKDSKMQQKSPGAAGILETKDPYLESSAITNLLVEKHENQTMAAGGNIDASLKVPEAHVCEKKDLGSETADKTSNQTLNGPVAGIKAAGNHDTLHELEEALQENLIKPKGDAELVNKLAEDFLPLSQKMEELNDTLHALKDSTAEKDELQKMKAYLKQRLDSAETAMFSGKGLPGFKCMSCAHRLEKLNPNRADFLPTNCMRRQVLPMHAAERLYHKDGEIDSPRAQGTTSPMQENQSKSFPTNSKQLLSPEPQAPPSKPTPAKKK